MEKMKGLPSAHFLALIINSNVKEESASTPIGYVMGVLTARRGKMKLIATPASRVPFAVRMQGSVTLKRPVVTATMTVQMAKTKVIAPVATEEGITAGRIKNAYRGLGNVTGKTTAVTDKMKRSVFVSLESA